MRTKPIGARDKLRDPSVFIIATLTVLLIAAGGFLTHSEAKLYDATHTTMSCGGARVEVELSTREAAAWAARNCSFEFEVLK